MHSSIQRNHPPRFKPHEVSRLRTLHDVTPMLDAAIDAIDEELRTRIAERDLLRESLRQVMAELAAFIGQAA